MPVTNDIANKVNTKRQHSKNSLAVYVHWPFCKAKCPYCDFNSHVRDNISHTNWCRSLVREIDYFADFLPSATVNTVFFGGGTPSLMEPSTAATIIDHIAYRWGLSENPEITLEANPTSTEAARFGEFRSTGINRVSLGAQAFNDDSLNFLGREHSALAAKRAIAVAQRIMPRSSFDLIYALPGQTTKGWRKDLSEALTLADGHISLYQLTIEKGTPFYQQHRVGRFELLDDEVGRALYDITQEITEALGFPAYEISNHAEPLHACQHNLAYWRYQDYVGIGPGAHGRIKHLGERWAFRQHASPETWLSHVSQNGHGTASSFRVHSKEQFREALMLGLRLIDGVSQQDLAKQSGCTLNQVIDRTAVERLRRAGYLTNSEDMLRTTPAGRPLLNSILTALLL